MNDPFALLFPLLSTGLIFVLPCSPETVPQITGGTLPAGPVNENESVRHCEAELIALPVTRSVPVAVLPPTS